MTEEKKVIRQTNDSRFRQAEYARNIFVDTAVFGTKPEDVMDPAYWAHVATKLSPYDRVEVRVDDGTWMIELLVLETGRNWARVFKLNHYQLETSDISQTIVSNRYETQWKGPHNKFAVIRLADKEMMEKFFVTKQAGDAWIESHEKTVGA